MVAGNTAVVFLCTLFIFCHFCLLLLKMSAFDKCLGDGSDEDDSVIARLWEDYPVWLLAVKVSFLGMHSIAMKRCWTGNTFCFFVCFGCCFVCLCFL
jgi:hypothetical protein